MSKFPVEFQKPPHLLPPDMSSKTNTEHLWLVADEWHTPPLDGFSIWVREPVVLPDGRVAGLWTDGVSVPALVWTVSGIANFTMPALLFALGHDAGYVAELKDQKTLDDWLFEWAVMAGVSRYQRNAAFSCVRLFGSSVWKKHTTKSIDAARQVVQLVKVGETPVWEPIVVAA